MVRVRVGAADQSVLPAWVALTVHLPVELVIVNVEPLMVQRPDAVIVTGSPEVAVAVTVVVSFRANVAGNSEIVIV